MKKQLLLVLLGLCCACQSMSDTIRARSFQAQSGKLIAPSSKLGITQIPYSTPDTNQLVGYYTLNGTLKDEISGSSGSTWGTMSYTNDLPAMLAGRYTNSAYFNGDGFINTINASLLNGATSFTVAVWAKAEGGKIDNDFCPIFSSRPTGGEAPVNELYYYWPSHAPYVYVDYSISSYLNVGFSPYGYGTWRHICYAGTTGSKINIYTNGYLCASSVANLSGTYVQNSIWVIGASGYYQWNYRMKGKVVQVLFYKNRVLTTNEILNLYQDK